MAKRSLRDYRLLGVMRKHNALLAVIHIDKLMIGQCILDIQTNLHLLEYLMTQHVVSLIYLIINQFKSLGYEIYTS